MNLYKKKDEKVLHQFFKMWSEIQSPEKDPTFKSTNKKQKKNVIKDFVVKFETLVLHLATKVRESWRSEGSSPTWASLFNQRMLLTKELLSVEKLDNMTDATTFYLKQKSEDIKRLEDKVGGGGVKMRKTEEEKQLSFAHFQFELAEEMNNFLKTHRLDPDSSLTGHRPSKRFSGQMREESDKRKFAPQYSKDDLLNKIRDWGKLDDKTLIREVREFYQTINIDLSQLKQGDIIILDLNQRLLGDAQQLSQPSLVIPTVSVTLSSIPSSTPLNTSLDLPLSLHSNGSSNGSSSPLLSHSPTTPTGLSQSPTASLEQLPVPPKLIVGSGSGIIGSGSGILFPEDNYIFARYSHFNPENRTVFVWTDAQEKSLVQVNQKGVIVIPEEKKEYFKTVRHLERIVENPVDEFYKQLSEDVKVLTIRYLQHQERIDMELLEKTNQNEVSVRLIGKLKGIAEKLQRLQASPPEKLLAEVNEVAKRESEAFVAQLNNDSIQIFYLSREQSINQLRNLTLEVEVRGRLQRYLSVCELGLEQIKIEIRQLMNGSQKADLTKWWLEMIREEVSLFLNRLGYAADAVPANYTDVPPESLNAIYHNLRIIQEILNPQNDVHNVKAMVNTLKKIIYSRIDDYIERAQIALSDQFGLLDEEFNIDSIEQTFFSTQNSLDSRIAPWIKNTIQDLRYLARMRQLEDNPQEKVLDVVPVSGLILGRFVRMENELKTVLELWEAKLLAAAAAAVSEAQSGGGTLRTRKSGSHRISISFIRSDMDKELEKPNSSTTIGAGSLGNSATSSSGSTTPMGSTSPVTAHVSLGGGLTNPPSSPGGSTIGGSRRRSNLFKT